MKGMEITLQVTDCRIKEGSPDRFEGGTFIAFTRSILNKNSLDIINPGQVAKPPSAFLRAVQNLLRRSAEKQGVVFDTLNWVIINLVNQEGKLEVKLINL